ncbi:sensor domain-containing protein [Metabacillus bambusae]|nr:PAS domain S-box protein [Metabacillus bambusae]
MTNILNQFLLMDPTRIFKLFTSAFNSLTDLIYIMEVRDEKISYLYANQSGLSVLSKDQTLIGKTFDEVFSTERAAFFKQHYLKAAHSKRIVTFEDEVVLPKGNKMISETVLTPIFDNEDIYIIAVVRDVTNRSKQISELQYSKSRLEENEQRLSSLVDYNEDAIFTFDLEGYFLEVNNAAEQITGYSNGELVGMNFSEIMSKKELETVNSRFQQTIEGDMARYETKIYQKDGHEVYLSVKNIPIIVDGTIKGVYGIAKEITSEKKALEEFHLVKSRFESFVRDSKDSIHIIDNEGKVQFINEAFTEIFGFTREEVIGRDFPTVPDWLKSETNNLYDEVLNGKTIQGIDVKRQQKSGELLDISLTLSPLYDEFGHVIGISGIGRDITEKKKSERELIGLKELLELVWNNTTDVIFMIDHYGAIVQANPTFEEMFDWKVEEIKQMSPPPINLEIQTKQLEGFLTRLREGEKFVNFETQRKRKDGTIIDVLATYRKIDKGNILAMATYKDVTDSRQIMNKLKESEERYRNLVEASPEALVVHSEGGITYINQAGLDLLKAKSPSQVIGNPVMDFVHPSDRKQVVQRIQQAINQGKKGETLEERFLTLDGDMIYAETASVPIQDHGKTSVLVMFRDITTKRRAEKAMRESEERFRIIAEHTLDMIRVLNPNGKVIYCSPSVENILGYPIRSLIGKSFFDLIHPDDVDDTKRNFENIFKTKEFYQIDFRSIHLDGHSIWLNSDFVPVISPEGEIEKIIVISGDITEKKRKEEKLAKMAFYDHLTGLPNRRLFLDRLQQAMYTTDRTGKLTALMVLDCDKFKAINDTFGHDIGDEVIKEFSRRIKLSLRKTDTLSRVGGDEFTIVLPELKNENEVVDVSKRILKVVREPMDIKGHSLSITTSIGVSLYPSQGNNTESLFKQADEALYKVKDGGGNTFSF